MKKIKLFLLITIFFVGFQIPVTAMAQNSTGGGSNNVNVTSTGGGSNSASTTRLANPLAGGNIDSIPALVESLLRIFLTVGVPLIALAIIYAGFKFVTAQGNPEKLEEAKQTFVWIVVGAAILLSAYAIAQGIKATILDIRGN